MSKLPKKTQSASNKPQIASTLDFLTEDYGRTLFPLKTNLLLARHAESSIRDHLDECLDESKKDVKFLPQQRVFAAKQQLHLRRTVKLDPVSEFFLYDVIFRNRARFRKPHGSNREHFGYRFEDGRPINPSMSYRAFKGAISEYRSKFKFFISFDVASYFNSIYHHDVVDWFRNIGVPETDVNAFSQMLREINSGRSIDFLPQGIYPSKMIGNDFLRFAENHYSLKSAKVIRFMDDFYLFSNTEADIDHDFLLIQELLGSKGLSINPQKTNRENSAHAEMDSDIDDVKAKLLERRRIMIMAGYEDETDFHEILTDDPLEDDELEYISSIIEKPHLEEDDAELILSIMRDNTDQVETRISDIAILFPNLTKNLYGFCAGVEDKSIVAEAVIASLKASARPLEFQLFWFAKILEDHLMDTPFASQIIEMLLNANTATPVSRAKVLEIPDARFGLPEAREGYLRDGSSAWTSWSSAIGTLCFEPGSRNHVLSYFGNASKMNRLIATAISGLPKAER